MLTSFVLELEHCFWPTPLEELDLRPPSPYPPEVSSCTLDSPYPQHEFCLSPSPISSPSPSSTSSTLPHSPSPNFVSCSLPPQPCSLPRSFPFSSLPLPKPTSHSLPPLLPHAHPQSTPPSHTFPPRTAHSLPTPSSQPPFTFDVLRPDPRTGALAHIASSRTRATHIPRFPYTQSHKPRKRTGTTAPSALVGPLTLAAARRLQKQAAGHHVCGVCRRAFDRASALTIHARTHSGVRRT